ncbi:hypothetical protein DSM104329_01632 [Capillimicrobium parvum]|uniref:Helix-turn-helix domain-containing protein n=1 Tax=Capillimicrobium parvum TaxID=2884022 RepID=A0A9E6XVM4_9ACTN|nr:hypothetical protein DSM104329_01632 [Capillimicrobium parvum]
MRTPSSGQADVGGMVIPFPDRFDDHGTRWQPWVAERVVANHFGVSGRTVRRWQTQGMPSRMVGGSRRYRLSICDEWLADRDAT